MTPIPELTTRHSNSKVVVSRLGFDPSTLALKGRLNTFLIAGCFSIILYLQIFYSAPFCFIFSYFVFILEQNWSKKFLRKVAAFIHLLASSVQFSFTFDISTSLPSSKKFLRRLPKSLAR